MAASDSIDVSPRRPGLTLAALSFLALLALAAAATPATEEWWVLVHQDGTQALRREKPKPADLEAAKPTAIWYGSAHAAPQRLADDELATREDVRDPDRLDVRVAPWNEELARSGLTLVAAPAPMWTEVAEPLLPRFPVTKDGTVSLPWRPGEPWRLRLVGRDRGSWWQDLPPGRNQASLAPYPAADVTVDAVDEDGAPLAVVSLAVSERASHSGSSRLLARYRTEDGTLVLPALPDGFVMRLTATAPDRVPATFTGQAPDVPRRWALERGAHLAGRFVDADGEPVPELRVLAASWIGDSTGRARLETHTDADGRWRIDDLPPGDTLLLAGKPGFAPVTRNLVLPPEGADLGDLRIEAGAELTVRVRDAAGAPIAGARAEIATVTPRTTDANGEARLEGLHRRQPNEVAVAAEGFLPRKVRVRPPLPATLDVTLEAGFVITGAYVDAQGNALDGAAVTVRDGPRTESQPLAADGRFELTLAPGRPVELLLASPATRPTLRSVAAGDSGRDLLCEAAVEVAAEGAAIVECASSGVRVAGLVTVGGVPAGAGTLLWLPPAPELPGLIVHHQPLLGQERAEAFGAGRPQVDVPVAPGGAFVTEALRAGPWHVLFASAQGWTTEAVQVALPDLDDFQVELEFPGHALAGRVVDAEGGGVAGARVRELASGVIATSGDDGRFHMVGLAAGTGYLKAYLEGRESAPAEVTLDPRQPSEPVVLVLREARNKGLEVTVVGPDAEPLAGALVVVEAEAGPVRILTTRDDGVG